MGVSQSVQLAWTGNLGHSIRCDISLHPIGDPRFETEAEYSLDEKEEEMRDATLLEIRANQAKWDRRYLQMATMVASWSKDPSTKCGAVIVRPDRTIASVGFNGFPRGVEDHPDLLNNRPEKYSRVIHAEVNAILSAKEPLDGFTMYTYPGGVGPSCDRCATCIIQSGISRVVHYLDQAKEFSSRWSAAGKRGLEMYAQARVIVDHLDEDDV